MSPRDCTARLPHQLPRTTASASGRPSSRPLTTPTAKASPAPTVSTTLATNAALNAHGEDVSIKEVAELARAARAAMQARTMSLKEREAVEEAARRKLLAEHEANLQEVAKAQGMDESQVDFWRRKFLGIGG